MSVKLTDRKIVLYYCQEHNEWFSNNCSNCMVDEHEPTIRKDEFDRVIEYIEKYVFYVDKAGYVALRPNKTKNWQFLTGGGG